MRPVRPGDTIGIVSPASAVEPGELDQIAACLARLGYRSRIFGRDDRCYGRLAADDATRARNVEAAFADESVAAVLCARGGYGSIRIIDRIDYAGIARNAKPFIGYSDITALIDSLVNRAGMVCFHGPMGIDLVGKGNARSIAKLRSVIGGAARRIDLRPKDFSAYRTGAAAGILKGGNIATLESILPSAGHDDRPAILLLEDTVEYAYRLDRSLHHLRRAGYFDNVVGLILADFRLKDDGPENSLGLPLFEIIDSHFASFAGPIALNVPCGHTDFQLTIPLGCEARLRVGEDRMSLGFGTLWDADRKGSGRATAPRPSVASGNMRAGTATLAGRIRSYLGKRP